MKTQWIRVRHVDTGGETDIPARSLESYMRRGWFQLAEFDEVVAPAAEPQPHADASGYYSTEENQ